MSANSKIEWTDHTFNPWEGCTKVSPGCERCYAEARDQRFTGGKHWGKGAPRRRTSQGNWKLPLKWNREAERAMQRPRVFCASLADWLDEEVPIEWLADLLQLIHRTPNLDWLLLTKRPENWEKRIGEVLDARAGREHEEWHNGTSDWLWNWFSRTLAIPHNVWIGTTVEDQPRADQRITALIKIPASVRFLSCEPLLGPVYPMFQTAIPVEEPEDEGKKTWWPALQPHFGKKVVHWVICGGESGHGARPMHPDWARYLREQCREGGAAFFFKQWGEWHPASHGQPGKVGAWDGNKFRPGWGNIEDETANMVRAGKTSWGYNLLDGVEHNEFPKP